MWVPCNTHGMTPTVMMGHGCGQDLKNAGCTPATKNKASEIIRSIRLAKRVKFLKEKARRKGTSPAVVEKLIALVMKYDL